MTSMTYCNVPLENIVLFFQIIEKSVGIATLKTAICFIPTKLFQGVMIYLVNRFKAFWDTW